MNVGNAARDVSDDFDLWEVNRIHLGTEKVDVDDFDAIGFHKERGLFHNIMTDIDDQVRRFDGAMNKVASRQCRVSKETRIAFVDDAFSHLGGDVVDVEFFDELTQCVTGYLSVGTGTHDQQRMFSLL